jgi:hypothetical protein
MREYGQGAHREPNLIGRRGCCTLEGQGMGYGAQPHDQELDELESMETLTLSLGCSSLGSFL